MLGWIQKLFHGTGKGERGLLLRTVRTEEQYDIQNHLFKYLHDATKKWQGPYPSETHSPMEEISAKAHRLEYNGLSDKVG